MSEGFVADHSYGTVLQSSWVEGEPERSFWGGTKTDGKMKMPISTLRCTGCGHLEFYARARAET